MPLKKGKLIAIEGIDGAGGSTQTNMLVAFLAAQKIGAVKLSYPDYEGIPGQAIRKYLEDRSQQWSAKTQFLLFAADMVKDLALVEDALHAGKHVIADRYYASTIAYQCSAGFPLPAALNFGAVFGIPKPDAIIYLDIRPGTSLARKASEGLLDRHEEDTGLLRRVAAQYKSLAAASAYGKWHVLDGEASVAAVFSRVQEITLETIRQ
ncbi:MAG: dTMP kinase [Candidatus Aenigmarchaeota archaeon]|nr:dTMP kinase [Candidatus Aenigmarchaeota archaeon]